MKQQGLIKPDDEQDLPSIGISKKWLPTEAVNLDGKDVVIARLVMKLENEVEKSSEFDAFVVERTRAGLKVLRFEDAYAIPKRIVAKIGHPGGKFPDSQGKSDPSFYYVELTGHSVVDAFKSYFLGRPYFGFSGLVVKGEKAPFDPTPNRAWKVVDGAYSVDRGNTAEVMDIQAYQFDEDFQSYFSGATQKESSTGELGAIVGPWGQSFIVEIVSAE